MLSPTATVVRNGQRDTIDADLLVPGDVVVIKSGDKVPADLRLLECSNLQVRIEFESCCFCAVGAVCRVVSMLGERMVGVQSV
jgi:hypothetical protein